MTSHHYRRRRQDHMQTQRSSFNFTIIISVPGPLPFRACMYFAMRLSLWCRASLQENRPRRRIRNTHKIDIFIVCHTLKQLVPFYFYFDRFLLFLFVARFWCFCYCLVILLPLHTTWMRHPLVLSGRHVLDAISRSAPNIRVIIYLKWNSWNRRIVADYVWHVKQGASTHTHTPSESLVLLTPTRTAVCW